MGYLTRDVLLQARPQTAEVEIEGLGTVRVRGLTAAERGRIESMVISVDPETQTVRYNAERAAQMNVLLAAYGLVDEDGAQLFDPQRAEDVRALAEVDGRVIGAIADAVRRLSGMDEGAAKKEQR